MEDSNEVGIKLEERFGRAKRNSISFSSILLLTSLVESDGTVAVAPLGADSEVSLVALLIILIASCTYFLIGYLRARHFVNRHNSKLAALHDEGAFTTVFDGFVSHVNSYTQRVQMAESYRNAATRLLGDSQLARLDQKYYDITQQELPTLAQWQETFRDKKDAGAIAVDHALMQKSKIDQLLNISNERYTLMRTEILKTIEHDREMEIKSEESIRNLIHSVQILTNETLSISQNIDHSDKRWFEWYEHYPTIATYVIAMAFAAVKLILLSGSLNMPWYYGILSS